MFPPFVRIDILVELSTCKKLVVLVNLITCVLEGKMLTTSTKLAKKKIINKVFSFMIMMSCESYAL